MKLQITKVAMLTACLTVSGQAFGTNLRQFVDGFALGRQEHSDSTIGPGEQAVERRRRKDPMD